MKTGRTIALIMMITVWPTLVFAQGTYNVADFGVVGAPHGSVPTDESAAFQSLLITVFNQGGGVIQFNARGYRFDSRWAIPNDGTAVPDQPSIRITGAGASHNGRGMMPRGGTIIDLRFTGSPAKIDTRGSGLLEVDHVSLVDGGGASSTPFIHTTNTTLKIHHALFYGNTPNTPTQDAIILGGTALAADGSSDSPFQGYGTVIENNWFNRVQRGVYGRTYANGNVIRDNTWWYECGGIAAIEFVGHSTNSDTGNVIQGNLIEMPNYVYGIKGTGLFQQNMVGPNSFFDPGPSVVAYVRFEAEAVFNLVIAGFNPGSIPFVSDASGGTQTIINAHQEQPSIFTQPVIWNGNITNVRTDGNPFYVMRKPDGLQFYHAIFGNHLVLQYQPSGGTVQDFVRYFPFSPSDKRLGLLGTGNSVLYAEHSDLRVLAAADKNLYLGTANHPIQIAVNDSNVTVNGGIAGGGTGLKHVRYAIGPIAPGATVDITALWNGVPFADTNYTITSSGIQDSSGSLQFVGIKSLGLGSVVVSVKNTDPVTARSGWIHLAALHD